jgi:hypothetical protein
MSIPPGIPNKRDFEPFAIWHFIVEIVTVLGFAAWLWDHRRWFRSLSKLASIRYVMLIAVVGTSGFMIMYSGILGFTLNPFYAPAFIAASIGATLVDIRFNRPKPITK